MAPITNVLSGLTRRQTFSITPSNPLKDHSFITIVVGIIVGGIVFLIILTLLLCLYRENSPLKRCCGRRFRRATETPPPPHLKQYEFSSAYTTPMTTPENSETELVKAPAPIAGLREVKMNGETTPGKWKRRRRARLSMDLSSLPVSKLLPFVPSLPGSPTQLMSLAPLSMPSPFLHKATGSSSSLESDETTISAAASELSEFAPISRRLLLSGDSFTQYRWLLDIIHDHTAGLFKHTRLSQMGPYRLAMVAGGGDVDVDADSGYCSSPATGRTGGVVEGFGC